MPNRLNTASARISDVIPFLAATSLAPKIMEPVRSPATRNTSRVRTVADSAAPPVGTLQQAARVVSEELLRFHEAKLHSSWELEIQSFQTAADLASSQGRYEDAMRLYKSALLRLVTAENAGADTHLTRACLQNNQALLLKRVESFEEASDLLRRSIQLVEREYPAERKMCAELYSNLGRLHAAASQFEAAMKAHEQSVELLRSRPTEALALAESLMHCGLTAARMHDDAAALAAFEEAAALLAARPATDRLLLDALVCLATAQVEMNRFTDAEKTLHDCLQRSQQMKLQVAAFQAVLWKMLGFVHVRLNRAVEAIHAYRTALQIYEDAYLTDIMGMAEAHFNLGVLYAVKQDDRTFSYHMRHAADLIDEQQVIVRERDRHFRESFDRHFKDRSQSLGMNEISQVLMLTTAGVSAPSEWMEKAVA
jgi:tetratricopeptide (TPR) repeat protein